MSERLRHLETMESVTQVGAYFIDHWSNNTAITGVAQTLIPAGGVTASLTVVYAVECIGVGIANGVTGGAPGGTFNLYNAGGNALTVTVAAGGGATVAVSAGAQTFNVSLLLLWI